MEKVVDYYLAPVSPWAYLGHERFAALLKLHGASVRIHPVDLGRVFPVSGGLPLAKRAPQRQAYRLVELARWSRHLGIALNAQPKFAASSGELASKWTLAARATDARKALDLAGALMRARWVEERDIADPATLAEIARALDLDAHALAHRAA